MNKHLEGLDEWRSLQRRRIKTRLTSHERRQQRIAHGVNDELDGWRVTELSEDNLSSLSIEVRS